MDCEISGKKNRLRSELFGVNGAFRKLVVIGRKETEIRRMTVAELLGVFGEAADENGMLLLSEQNVRILCQGDEEKREDLQQNMG